MHNAAEPEIEPDVDLRTPRVPIVAASIGNAMEWYDFGVYAYFATIIATNFFPGGDSSAGVLLTFATFGVGFVMRPIGGIIFAHYGDKHGRRASLTLTVGLMGLATFAMGFIPSYESIGIAAPVMLLILRLIQGFSVGGEYAGSTSFLVEYANPRRRGLIGSMQSVSVFAGSLTGSLAGLLVTSTMSEAAVNSYGWRIPFIAGGILGVVALYMRLKLDETPAFKAVQEAGRVDKAPIVEVFKERGLQMVQLFLVVIYFTVSYYIVLIYAPTFLTEEAGLPLSMSLLATSIGIVFGMIVVPIAGHLSDRVGRKPVLLAAAVLSVLVAYPAFVVMHQGSTITAVIGIALIMLPTGMLYGVGPTMFAEAMPTRLRYAGVSIPYNLATSTFGGFAAFIATYLIRITGDPLSPSFYVIAAAILALVVLLKMKETARDPLQ